MSTRRRLAYADPPYPGTAHERYRGREVNLPLLVAYLETFDGWALSTSTPALRELWNLAPHARVAAWAKTFAPNGFSRVRYSWEPVLFVTDRRGIDPGDRSTVWDALVSASDCSRGWREVDGKPGGAKPAAFVAWVLDLLDADPGDEVVDVFPGSGAVGRYLDAVPLELPLTPPGVPPPIDPPRDTPPRVPPPPPPPPGTPRAGDPDLEHGRPTSSGARP